MAQWHNHNPDGRSFNLIVTGFGPCDTLRYRLLLCGAFLGIILWSGNTV